MTRHLNFKTIADLQLFVANRIQELEDCNEEVTSISLTIESKELVVDKPVTLPYIIAEQELHKYVRHVMIGDYVVVKLNKNLLGHSHALLKRIDVVNPGVYPGFTLVHTGTSKVCLETKESKRKK